MSSGAGYLRHFDKPDFIAGISEKYLLNIFFLGDVVAEWLASEFTLFGVHFQNWMPLALAIVVLGVLFQWHRSRN
jgi:hypothetical protein